MEPKRNRVAVAVAVDCRQTAICLRKNAARSAVSPDVITYIEMAKEYECAATEIDRQGRRIRFLEAKIAEQEELERSLLKELAWCTG